MKILVSGQLKFGKFENTNDIAEVKREMYSTIDSELFFKELALFRFLSLTKDDTYNRGFSIDSLWGYYANNGNGVCMVFDKDRLEAIVKSSYKNNSWCHEINYLDNFTNAKFWGEVNEENLSASVIQEINDVFFTKSTHWVHENEYRLLIKEDGGKNCYINYEDSLISVILCMPKIEDDKFKESYEYKVLKRLCVDIPILHYTTSLGNKELLDENNNKLWPVPEVDYYYDDKSDK